MPRLLDLFLPSRPQQPVCISNRRAHLAESRGPVFTRWRERGPTVGVCYTRFVATDKARHHGARLPLSSVAPVNHPSQLRFSGDQISVRPGAFCPLIPKHFPTRVVAAGLCSVVVVVVCCVYSEHFNLGCLPIALVLWKTTRPTVCLSSTEKEPRQVPFLRLSSL